jgi:hypothetical protein
MSPNEASEFAKLKRDFAALETRVRALEANSLKPPTASPANAVKQSVGPSVRTYELASGRRLDQADVRITTIADAERFSLPDDADMRKLCDVANRRLPALGVRPGADEEEFFRSFCAAFRYLGNVGRAAEINKKLGHSWWAGACGRWLVDHGIRVSVNGPAFIAAVVAHGDIGYVVADPAVGAVWEFALESYGGRPASDAWRKVLRGEFLKPRQPSGLPTQSPAEVRYFG